MSRQIFSSVSDVYNLHTSVHKLESNQVIVLAEIVGGFKDLVSRVSFDWIGLAIAKLDEIF